MPDTTNKALRYAHEASLGMPSSIKDVADFLLSEGTGIADLTMAQVAADDMSRTQAGGRVQEERP